MQWACFNSAWFSLVTKINPIKGNWVLYPGGYLACCLPVWRRRVVPWCLCALVHPVSSPSQESPCLSTSLLSLLDDRDCGHLTHCSSGSGIWPCQSGALCFPGEQTELAKFWSHEEHRMILELQVIPKTERTGPAHDPLCSLAEELGHCPAGDGASRRILSQRRGAIGLFYILQLLPLEDGLERSLEAGAAFYPVHLSSGAQLWL